MTCSNVNFAADGAALLAMFAVLFQLVSLILFYDARGLHGLCVSDSADNVHSALPALHCVTL